MSLRIRLALIFALVAIITASAIAIVTPVIVDHGFAPGRGTIAARFRPAGRAWVRVHERVEVRAARSKRRPWPSCCVAIVAAAGASVLGFLVAGRLVAPLGRLRDAAADVAAGNLERRSGLAGRSDEIGDLGRSFDGMAERSTGPTRLAGASSRTPPTS